MTIRLPLKIELYLDNLRIAVCARSCGRGYFQKPSLYRQAKLRYAPGVCMELVPGDVISDNIAFTGAYELLLTRRVSELARKGALLSI